MKKYQEYIDKLLEFETEITDVIDIDNYKFVFFQPKDYTNPYNDDKLNYITNMGPLRINKLTNNYEIIGAIQFLFEYGDREEYLRTVKEIEKPDYQNIVDNIKQRASINWSEFDEVLNLLLGENSMRNVFYTFKGLRKIEILIEDEKAKKIIVSFLKDVSANYIIQVDNTYLVDLDIV